MFLAPETKYNIHSKTRDYILRIVIVTDIPTLERNTISESHKNIFDFLFYGLIYIQTLKTVIKNNRLNTYYS